MVLMERIGRDEMLMDVVDVVARRGTCSRAQVGMVFAREGRILVTGYNGAPAGLAHCDHHSWAWEAGRGTPVPDWLVDLAETHPDGFDQQGGLIRPGHSYHWDGRTLSIRGERDSAPGCTVVEHAERNAIAYAAREGIRLGGSRAYCSYSPCEDCARSLISVGIESLTFRTPYRRTDGVELLKSVGIDVIDLSIAE